ncbi:MAG: hypothetical protein GY794_24945 [bacterium]|nr:hypothetical protein [bacterium]
MGTIHVRVESEGSLTPEPGEGVRGAGGQIARGRTDISKVVSLNSDQLASSLRDLTGELGKLFTDLLRVGDFELKQVEVGLEISAEGGFSLIGSVKAGGKGAVTLTFAPGSSESISTGGND